MVMIRVNFAFLMFSSPWTWTHIQVLHYIQLLPDFRDAVQMSAKGWEVECRKKKPVRCLGMLIRIPVRIISIHAVIK